MNKKAVVPPLVLLFVDVVFIGFWIYFLGDWLTLTGNMMLLNDVTGVEQLFYANLNLFVGLIFVMFNAGVLWGSSN